MRLPLLLSLALPLVAQSPDLESSTLALPIRVDLASLMKQVEAQVPLSPSVVETWAEVKGKPRTYFRYNLIREPLQAQVKDAQVNLRVVANYGMDVGLRTLGNRTTVLGSCGRAPEAPRRVQLDLRAELGLLPNWGLELRQPAFEVQPLNTCTVTVLGFDITDQVAAGMRKNLSEGLDTLAKLVRESALARQKAQEAWTLLSQPTELRPDLYLVFQPKRVRMTPPTTQNGTLIITPEIEVSPKLVLGAKPQVKEAPLPDLTLQSGLKPGFHIRVDAELSYAHATKQLVAEVVGKTFETDKGRFEITSARVWGEQGKAMMEVGLKGKITGKVTLSGKPVMDAATGQLRFEGLDFELASQSWLNRLGVWIYHGDLRKLLVEKAHFLMDQSFQDLRGSIQASLNRPLAPNLRLRGGLKGLQVAALTTGPQAFLTQASLEGEVALEMK